MYESPIQVSDNAYLKKYILMNVEGQNFEQMSTLLSESLRA